MATTTLQAVYDQAQRLLEENETERAIGLIEHLLEHFPDNLEAHRLLGEAYLITRQFEQAEAAFRQVLNADPENIPAHVGIGITYERQGRLDRAMSEFEQALEIKPDMAELRTQLLRLYVDAWGSEHAQLRLSRPGLARLYAKGHMLPQAIQEFRGVVADQPDRFDARVGLIEALWRQGEEDMVVEVCEEILTERRKVLKANLLLGYIKLAAGDPTGERYWCAAQQLDPYQQVATALFGAIPEDAPVPATSLPQWNELEWRLRREQEKQVVSTPATEVTQGPPVTMSADGAPLSPLSDEDFLSQLLGLPGGAAVVSSEEPVAPFTFAEPEHAGRRNGVSESPGRSPQEIGAGGAAGEGDELELSDVQPFDFAFDIGDVGDVGDIGDVGQPRPQPPSSISMHKAGEREADDFAFEAEAPPAPESPDFLGEFPLPGEAWEEEEQQEAPPTPPKALEPEFSSAGGDLPEMEPFSWGFEDEDQGETEVPSSAAEPAQPTESAQPAQPAQPFDIESLDEFAGIEPFGVSPSGEEPAQPFGMESPGAFAGIEPFELPPSERLPPERLPSREKPAKPAGMPEHGTPRSPRSPESLANIDPFDWSTDALDSMDEASWGEEDQSLNREGISGSLQPFSLDDLELGNIPGQEDASLPPSLQPFSLEESGESPHPVPGRPTRPEPLPTTTEEETHQDTGVYSWQLPSSKSGTDFLREPRARERPGTSIFSKLKQRRQELPPQEEPPLLSVSVDDEEALQFFSDDNISLRADEDEAVGTITGGAEIVQEAEDGPLPFSLEEPDHFPAGAEPVIAPLSLEELGLSPEEVAQLNQEQGLEPEPEWEWETPPEAEAEAAPPAGAE
ncbi:MAG: tetratricopeptide repeat protein, partial [Chloroflexaceae bacterium]|nr:tetratricopeptide repeat protein [Chloroflexaceae bacterium]